MPFWLKITWTAFGAVILAMYWRHYGPVNYLWFSDLALIGSVIAIWTQNRLLAGTMTVVVLFCEIGWNLSFFVGLLTGGYAPFGMASYMFDPQRPLHLRALSLFHVPLPILLIWMIRRWGYDRRAIAAATLLSSIVLPLSALFSTEGQNVNWVYGLGKTQTWVPQWVWVAGLMIFLPAFVYTPTHRLLIRFFNNADLGEPNHAGAERSAAERRPGSHDAHETNAR